MTISHIKPKPLPRGLTLIELIVVLIILVGLGGLVIPRIIANLDETRETTTRASLERVRDAVLLYWSDCKYLIAEAEGADPDFGVRIDDLLANPFGAANEYNPATGLGWRGPYLVSLNTTTIDDPANPFLDLPDAFRLDTNLNQYFRVDTTTVAQVPSVPDNWGTPLVIQDVTSFIESSGTPATSPVLGQPRVLRIVSAGPGTAGDLNSLARKNSIKIDHLPTTETVNDNDNDDYSLTFVVR